MLRYGAASSVQWFYVESSYIFHIFNYFQDGYEVVVRRWRSLTLVFPCHDWGMNKFNWFSRGFNSREPVDANANKHGSYLFTCAYEWRLNVEIGKFRSRLLWALNSLWTSLSWMPIWPACVTSVVMPKSSNESHALNVDWLNVEVLWNYTSTNLVLGCLDSDVLVRVFQVILIIHCTCWNAP